MRGMTTWMIYCKKLEVANEVYTEQAKEGSNSLFTKQTYESWNWVTSSKLLKIYTDVRQKLDISADKKFEVCQTQTVSLAGKVIKLQTSKGI